MKQQITPLKSKSKISSNNFINKDKIQNLGHPDLRLQKTQDPPKEQDGIFS